jgi:hypothetical protein
MKKQFLILATLIFTSVLSSFATNIIINNDKENRLEVIENTYSALHLKSTVSTVDFSNIFTENGTYVKVEIQGYGKSLMIGEPELPVLKKLIEIPLGAQIKTKIISSSFKDYNLADLGFPNQIIPARAPISKNIDDPESIEYIPNQDSYSTNSFMGQENVIVKILGSMREVLVGRIEIAPVQYNPVSNTLRVFDELEIVISFKDANIPLTKSSKQDYFSPYFEHVYSSMLNLKPKENKELITDSPVTYIIVSDPMFEDNLQPFIEWKTKKGFLVVEAYTDDPNVGNTTESIKSYLEGFYNDPPEGYNPQSFILIVGDVDQVPAFTGNFGGHITDLYYAEYTGDIFPECCYGRFSANNQDELEAQLNKNLEYEMYQFPEPSFLDSTMLIAGIAPGYDTIWGNGQLNYMINNYLNGENGIFAHLFTPPFSPDTNYTELIIQSFSDGVSFVNYTGHCSTFGFSNPPLSIGNIADFTNEHKYPLVIGNCCSSASFNTMCFGEQIVRATNKGALSFIGAASSTYWDEDYWWMIGFKDISSNPQYSADNLALIDRWFHINNEAPDDWYITQGQFTIAGNLSISQSGSGLEGYYWEVYNLLGDPSVMVYLPQPELPEVYHSSSITLQTETLLVYSEPYTYIALSINNVLHGIAMADENGVAEVNISLPFTNPGTADIVVTGQNMVPYFGTVKIEDPESAYVMMQSFEIDDSNGNNDGNADAGENILLDITLFNFGSITSGNITASLSTSDTNIALINGVNTWSSLEPDNSEIKYGAFSFNIDQFCENGHIAEFDLEITDGNNTWNSLFSITIHSVITETPEILNPETISELVIYPNPFSDQITLDFILKENTNVNISLIDLLGKQHLYPEPGNLNSSGRQSVILKTDGLLPGLYLCKIQAGNHSIIKRIVLTR